MAEKEFILLRNRLHKYFESKSASEGIPIHPILRDDRTMRLFERLYEEELPQRHFHVCPRHGGDANLDGFTKKTGPKFEVSLLVLSIDFDERFFPAIWDAYVDWMHKGTDADVILNMINSANRRP